MPATDKAKSVSQIKSSLLRPALTSHFEVEIPMPSSPNFSRRLGLTDQARVNLMCAQATLPGSNLATLDINNDYTGVTEKHVHRRVFDDRIDLSFYVDADNYVPIRFFENWMEFSTNGRFPGSANNERELMKPNYYYRMEYPDEYIADQGLIVRKFERDYKQLLEYEFVRAFPLAISSMPVSYDTSSLLKCTVSFSYIRYVMKSNEPIGMGGVLNPFQQSQYNNGGLNGLVGNLADAAVTTLTGNRFLGDLAGAIVPNLL